MSLIEQAAQRLEQLRRAGVDLPASVGEHSADFVTRAANESATRQETAVQLELAPDRPAPASPELPVVAPPSSPPPAERGAALPPEKPRSQCVELDLEALTAAGVICPDSTPSQLADEYRVVKRPLIDNAMGKGAVPIKDGNLIMITSALPGEGKTFTAVNLAMSIAMELDHTVMLVDADVARSTLLKVLGVSPRRGLLDVLVDESIDLSQVLLRTNIEKLTVLPSGTPHPRATELLASVAMVRLLENMAHRYADRIIIFDSPPLLVTTEARALATHMGQVVMVVKAEGTARSDVMHALATLDACPVKLMLLNQARSLAQDGYAYGYGYDGYRYGNS